jgi:RNA 3'-terminal phosphate cyclase (ATP)
MMSRITVDASLGEGGGQIFRLAMGLSAIMRKPLALSNIRAKRAKPGLAAQHLTGVEVMMNHLTYY